MTEAVEAIITYVPQFLKKINTLFIYIWTKSILHHERSILVLGKDVLFLVQRMEPAEIINQF